MKLAIVILNYNTFVLTLKFISNLRRIGEKRDFDLIVVDNNSNNESQDVLERESLKQNFALLLNDTNSGYAAGNNVGIKQAIENGADYILVANNDIELNSFSVIDNMIALMKENERIGAVSPKIIGIDNKKDPPIYFKRPSLWDLSFGIISFNKKRFKFDDNSVIKVYAPRGSFMLLRATSIQKAGYLDENTFLYYEEPILAERMKTIGLECWHYGTEYVVHNHGETIKSTYKRKNICAVLLKSQKYYLKHYRHMNALSIWLCSLFRKMVFYRKRK